ncbi:hypothetical protein LguiA_015689 [Lonicera macranthoides]
MCFDKASHLLQINLFISNGPWDTNLLVDYLHKHQLINFNVHPHQSPNTAKLQTQQQSSSLSQLSTHNSRFAWANITSP